ncbi:hypothetical protein AAA799E16_00152 [Marine Group I thaumarchaeote SCGC AAA799-E16]|uniref:Glycerophosphoryl diester phosphodiesterase protein n=2 Tax=Marine Group I TaxID=905826 RepID=A0A087S248_9ARCH|nr:hypothetical protein AAA799E16_00152 [Marine Group I thaumarchaeote SCGC AAA799-E16]KFM19802.1 hypothetical protein SCCGRSA3_00332 [Marine Group I thaumarchaeote SCGC RSA3]
MEILKHRVNSFDRINNKFGIEIDIRDYNGDIVISHDPPHLHTIKLEEFLKKINKNRLIAINIKSMEIEERLKEIINEFELKNYFTFDWSIPSLIKAQKKNIVCAFRLSEYEKEFFPNCTWVWVDSFEEIWYDKKILSELKDKGFKIALVSPELHGRKQDFEKFEDIVHLGIADAICTNNPEYWYK